MTTTQKLEPPLDSSVALYRTARLPWDCQCPGGAGPCPHPDFCILIRRGDRYVEYVGEALSHESGKRYCLPCGIATWGCAT